MTLNFKDVNERKRTYVFPNGQVIIENVTQVAISNTTHRVENAEGMKFIIPSGWIAIVLDMDEWSF